MKIFIEPLTRATERARVQRRRCRQRVERPHIYSDQLVRQEANQVGKRSVDTQNIVVLVVHHNVVADRIEYIEPMPVGLLHLSKETSILQSDASVAGNRPQ